MRMDSGITDFRAHLVTRRIYEGAGDHSLTQRVTNVTAEMGALPRQALSTAMDVVLVQTSPSLKRFRQALGIVG